MVSSAPFPIGNTAGRHHAAVRQSSPIISFLMSMDYFWVATVSLHLLAAVMWIGGMLFLVFVVVSGLGYGALFTAATDAVAGREVKKLPTLKGRLVINMFYESSTRTSSSSPLPRPASRAPT